MGFVVLLVYVFSMLAVPVAVAVFLLEWIVRPIASLARRRRCRTQFAVADLLVLFAMLQFTVGTTHYLLSRRIAEPGSAEARDRVADALFADAVIAVLLLLSWWAGLAMVSRAGIRHWWHRAIGLGFLVPCTVVTVVATVFLTPLAFYSLIVGHREATLILLGILSANLAVAGVCGAVTRWIAGQYRLGQPAKPLDSEDAPPPRSAPVEE